VTGDPPAADTIVWRLIWHGQSIDVSAGQSVMGRDRGCAICIDADSVSRHHARLNVMGHQVSIEDLGSKNGTWLAGERIVGITPLADGVSFRLGSETVRLETAPGSGSTKTAVVS
jgi:pSer/pThr/pTyr-binding forkhead associated (FHA) protein